jgi:hypothetical protein
MESAVQLIYPRTTPSELLRGARDLCRVGIIHALCSKTGVGAPNPPPPLIPLLMTDKHTCHLTERAYELHRLLPLELEQKEKKTKMEGQTNIRAHGVKVRPDNELLIQMGHR